jgi:nucleoside 2-deoxyribosyltransferase
MGNLVQIKEIIMARGWIYLAGPIGGCSYNETIEWRTYVTEKLNDAGMVTYSPMRAKEFLSEEKCIDEQDYDHPMATLEGITARDRWDVMRCDLVFMNLLNEDRFSIGTCIEIGWADLSRKPIVLVCKKDGLYHKHPIVKTVCGFIVHNLNDGIEITKQILLPG